jgi:hypothetical protein
MSIAAKYSLTAQLTPMGASRQQSASISSRNFQQDNQRSSLIAKHRELSLWLRVR